MERKEYIDLWTDKIILDLKLEERHHDMIHMLLNSVYGAGIEAGLESIKLAHQILLRKAGADGN